MIKEKEAIVRDWAFGWTDPQGDAQNMFDWIATNREGYSDIRIVMLDCKIRSGYFCLTLECLKQLCCDSTAKLKAQGVRLIELTYDGAYEHPDIVWQI